MEEYTHIVVNSPPLFALVDGRSEWLGEIDRLPLGCKIKILETSNFENVITSGTKILFKAEGRPEIFQTHYDWPFALDTEENLQLLGEKTNLRFEVENLEDRIADIQDSFTR